MNFNANFITIVFGLLGIGVTIVIGILYQNRGFKKRFLKVEQMLNENFANLGRNLKEIEETLNLVYDVLQDLRNRSDRSITLIFLAVPILIGVIFLIILNILQLEML